MEDKIRELWSIGFSVSEIAFILKLTCDEVVEELKEPIDFINESYE